MKYEYKVVAARNKKDAEEKMNSEGQQGWRVCHINKWNSFLTRFLITFEKEIK